MGLANIIERHAQLSPAQVALHFSGEDITYAELWRRIQRATEVLLAAGIQPGDRVAWLGLNDPALLVLLFALARIGAILLPLNYRLATPEQTAILQHAGAAWLVADAVHADAAPTLGTCRLLQAADLSSAPDGSDARVLSGGETSPVLLVYTSGTTGQPKGVLHTQAGLVWNCVISTHAHELTQNDHVLSVLPMFHVGGLCIQTLPALHAGATVTLHARFDPAAWLGDVEKRRPTLSLMVPATLRAVLEHADFAKTDVSSLKLLAAGSSTIPAAMIAAIHARGVPVCQVYGATETGPVSIYLRREDAMAHVGSAGQAGLHVAVRLVNDTGEPVAVGEVGELWVRGPNLLCGYWKDADNPALAQGWFHTGDLARCDDAGFYEVVGRSKDMIISGGENVYPAEIENLLADCPQIAEVAVVGQPDSHWGEVVVAVVVKTPGADLDVAAVMRLFEGRLARFKHPKRILFCDALPKTALGKVQKAGLLERLGQ
ncbi:class I adenylate-forming enzyme family protein [Polaromonas sp. SM01]|uniref:class I adenylate-forming enzyme family protein n=1 Tax=Polaromonas sp. SM01 TaxID=3085630 RepID=UPI0029812CA6|nr:AMP-binding protein [Polaromonas sp. SM01]MDW5441704.1 AMP-binding protein [Polaromonas sp. SM01]